MTSNRHYRSLTRDIYPFIDDKPIDEITKAELLKIIQPHEILGPHEVAHRLHDRLGQFLSLLLVHLLQITTLLLA